MREDYLNIPWNFERNRKNKNNKLEERVEETPYVIPKEITSKEKLPLLARAMAAIAVTTLAFNIAVYHSPLTEKYFTQRFNYGQNEEIQNEKKPKFKGISHGASAEVKSKDTTSLNNIYDELNKRLSKIEYVVEKEISYKIIEKRIKNFNENSKFTIDEKVISNIAIKDAYKKLMKYYFSEYNEELLGLEGFFVNYCFEKKIDPAFVFSIIYNESTVGTQGWGYYNKNPGNLRGYGTLGERGGYAYFRTWKDGIKALIDLLSENYSNLSVKKAIYIYAPPNENETDKLTIDVVNVTRKALKRVYNYLKTGSVILKEDNQGY